MFERFQEAPADPILGLMEIYATDPRENKVNLTVGVYQDEAGETPVLPSVRQAGVDLLSLETTKAYLPISGPPELGTAVRDLLFGAGSPLVDGGRAVTAQTPGGTGGLRISGDFLKNHQPQAKIWLSSPTWPNHPAIFRAAGLSIAEYPYLDPATGGLGVEAMLEALRAVPAGDVVVLHGCCHNPTGVDPDQATWREIASIASAKGWLPLVDLAYQGFGEDLEKDVQGLREIAAQVPEFLVCSSFSKIFGLYRERIGAMTLVAATPAQAKVALSQLKISIRTSYSTPPAHGGQLVSMILRDPARAKQWRAELLAMRERIQAMRSGLADALRAAGAEADFDFLRNQRGMFSLLGITQAQVASLREEHGIYLVGSGRINVAGLSTANLDVVARAIVAVGG
jgi:aspartate/tyrosine/aromatic aminotransferase